MGTVIGVDPGVSGAIAVLDGARYSVYDMPTVETGKGFVKRAVDAVALREILAHTEYHRPVIYLERVNAFPGQGSSSMFSLGQSFGTVIGVAAGLGIRLVLVESKAWKGYYGLTADKELARSRAVGLFPLAPLIRKKDHNRAEALLIVHYGRHLTLAGIS